MTHYNIEISGAKSKFIDSHCSRNYHLADKNGRAYLCGCIKCMLLGGTYVKVCKLFKGKGSLKYKLEPFHKRYSTKNRLNSRVAQR